MIHPVLKKYIPGFYVNQLFCFSSSFYSTCSFLTVIIIKFSSTENASGQIPLKFTYDVMTNPNNEDVKSDDFRNYIGDILVECVEEQLEKGQLQIDE